MVSNPSHTEHANFGWFWVFFLATKCKIYTLNAHLEISSSSPSIMQSSGEQRPGRGFVCVALREVCLLSPNMCFDWQRCCFG